MQYRGKLAGLFILAAALCFLFGPALIKSEAPNFRDTGHFYFPSMQWEQSQWRSGEIPLWNQQENFGRPYVADGSSSVFYPGKLLLLLPISFSTTFTLFIALHFVIAAMGSYWCAKRISGSSEGALIASISYTLGGCLISTHCNLIYLVGAAWLPWAVSAAFTLHQTPSLRSSCRFAVPLSLITLGGDPQLTFHLLVVYALICLFAKDLCVNLDSVNPVGSATQRWRTVSLLWVIPAILFLMGLSAIQILPSYEWSQEAERMSRVEPVSLWDLKHFPNNEVSLVDSNNSRARVSGLLGKPAVGSHGEKIYNFSIAPWQYAELVWPNVTGRLYPEPQRWTSRLNEDTRIWYPSLYAGLIPLLLAVASFSFRRKRHQPLERTLTFVFGFVVLASLGYFGVGWLTNQIHDAISPVETAGENSPTIGSQVGGLYWFLTLIVPGYSQFRYPAKWFVIASFIIALLAAISITKLQFQKSRRLSIASLVACIVSGVLLVSAYVFEAGIREWMDDAPVDLFLGPLSVDGAIGDLRFGLIQSVMISVLFLILLRIQKHRALLLAIVVAADLLFANSWMLQFSQLKQPTSTDPSFEEQLIAHSDRTDPQFVRISRSQLRRWMPEAWSKTSSPNRLAESATWERQVLKPRTHLASEIGVLESETSIRNAHVQSVLKVLRRHGDKRSDGIHESDPAALQQLGIEFMLITPKYTPSIGSSIETVNTPEESQWWKLPNANGFAYSVSKATLLATIDIHRQDELLARSETVYYPEGVLRDFSTEVVIETLDEHLPLNFNTDSSDEQDDTSVVTVESITNSQIVLHVESTSPHYVVVNQLFDSGWHASAVGSTNVASNEEEEKTEHRELSLHRANRIVQAMQVPAGTWTITLRYMPRSFEIGRWVTLGSVMLLFFVLTLGSHKSRHRQAN